MIGRRRRKLGRDERGVTIVEFAIVVPVMLLLIMGLAELSYRAYVQSILTGAMQKAARDSAIQGGAQQSAALDQSVMNMIHTVAKTATYVSTRKFYTRFGDIGPEPFTDSNANGVHDTHECFSDVNGNGSWDSDPGSAGQGGASDVSTYTMVVTYPHLFPLTKFLGWTPTQTIQSTTILKNQPFATQSKGTVATVCP